MQFRRLISLLFATAMLCASPALALRTTQESIRRSLHEDQTAPEFSDSFTLSDQTTKSSDHPLDPPEPAPSIIAHKHIYWLLPDLNQRIGRIKTDKNHDNINDYPNDPPGSVQQIVEEDSHIVNPHNADTYSNIRRENTFEGLENRYTFRDREDAAHTGKYRNSNRINIIKWCSFISPNTLDPHSQGDGTPSASSITCDTLSIGIYFFYNNSLFFVY